MKGCNTDNMDNMEYQQDMFTYASNGDGTARGNHSPLSNTTALYDHCITVLLRILGIQVQDIFLFHVRLIIKQTLVFIRHIMYLRGRILIC